MAMIFDAGLLSGARPAPGGGILVDGRIGRSGIQVYRRADGSQVRAYRPPEEVRAADFTGAPLTLGHPLGGVSPENFRAVAIGIALGRSGEETLDGHVFQVQTLQVNDAAALTQVQAGELCELSCGYDAQQDWTPGTVDGHEYDVVFRGITANHIALGGKGFARAGRGAKLLLDSEGDLMAEQLVNTQATTTPPVATPQTQVAQSVITDGAEIRIQLEAARGALAAAETRLAQVPQQIADAVSAALAEREATERRAAKLAQARLADATIADNVSEVWLDGYLAHAAKAPELAHDYNQTPGSVNDGLEDIQSYVKMVSQKAYNEGRK